MHRRPGLTRIEALVGLLIAGLVVGLFLVGIAKIRESANQMRCSFNLYQLGLAIHGWHDTYGVLPPLTDQGAGAPTGLGLPSVFANLTPFLEADPWNYHSRRTPEEYHAHSSVLFPWQNKDGTPGGMLQGGVANQIRRTFVDPSDPTANSRRDVLMTLPDGTTGFYATGSYAANGLLPWGTGITAKAFPRGTDNTILIGERPQVCRTAAGEEVYNLWGVGFYSPHMPAFACLTPADPPGMWSTGQVAPVEPLPDDEGEVRVRIGRHDAAAEMPDFPTPMQRVREGRPCDPRLPGGPHSAGMLVAMADGSVRVFGWDTSAWVFWRACVAGGPAEQIER